MLNDYGVLGLIMQLIGALCIGESSRGGRRVAFPGDSLTYSLVYLGGCLLSGRLKLINLLASQLK